MHLTSNILPALVMSDIDFYFLFIYLFSFTDIQYPNIVWFQISDTDINRYQYMSLYCDFPLDVSHVVISYEWAFLLAASHHSNHLAGTLALFVFVLWCGLIIVSIVIH